MTFREQLKSACPSHAHLSDHIADDETLALEMLRCMRASVQHANSRANSAERNNHEAWLSGVNYARNGNNTNTGGTVASS